MYLVLNESMVTPGRVIEAEALSQRLFELQGRQPGFQRGGLLTSTGFPSKYIRVTLWDSPAAYRAFARSRELTDFLQENPLTGLITFTRPIEGFDVLTARIDPGTPTAGVVVEGTAAPGKAAALEASRNELITLFRTIGTGIVTSVLARSLANQNRYLIYHSFLSAEDMQATSQHPDVQAWAQQHLGAYWANGMDSAMEQVEVVQVHAPVRV